MADITLDDLFAADSQSGGGAAPSLSDLLDSDEQSQKNWGTGPKQAIEAVTGPSAAQQIEIAKRAPKGSINSVEELTPPPPTLGEQTVNVGRHVGGALAAAPFDLSSGLYGVARAFVDQANDSPVMREVKARGERTILDPVADWLTSQQQQGKAMADSASGPDPESFVGQSLKSGIRSVPSTVVALGLSAFGMPELGLGILSAQTGGGAYGDARDKVVDPDQAAIYAASQAAIEYGSEKIPVLKYFEDTKVGTPFARKLVNNILSELGGEEAATAGQDFNEWAVLHPERSFADYVRDRPSAALSTAIAVAVGSSVAVSAEHSLSKIAARNTPGIIETARDQSSIITPEDDASPLPNELIAAGRAELAGAEAMPAADDILARNGAPKVGSRVSFNMGGRNVAGTINDAFSIDGGEAGSEHGVKITLDDGSVVSEPFSVLNDMGVRLAPLSDVPPEVAALGTSPELTATSVAADDGPSLDELLGGNSVPILHPRDRKESTLPVQGRITSPFGHRDAPKAGASTEHGGIDIAVPIGTPVKAPAGGTVVSVGKDPKNGNFVRIDHGNGVVTGYAHLNGASVKVGDQVEAGQDFATSGNSGNSTEPHLHWTTKINGKPVDPTTHDFGSGPVTATAQREPVYDENDTGKQVGWLNPETGQIEPVDTDPGVEMVSMSKREAMPDGAQAATERESPLAGDVVASVIEEAQKRLPQGYSIKVDGNAVRLHTANGNMGDGGVVSLGDVGNVSRAQIDDAVRLALDDHEVLTPGERAALQSYRPPAEQVPIARAILEAGRTNSTAEQEAVIESALRAQGEVSVSESPAEPAMAEPAFEASSPSVTSGAASVAPTSSERTALIARAKAKRTGPVDAITFLADAGGIRDDEGHNLHRGRNLQRMVPKAGPLIRTKGMTIDAAGELLHDAGYFGPPSTAPRPTEDQVLQFIERAHGTKTYVPDVSAEKMLDANDQASAESEARARSEVVDAIAELRLNMTDADIDAAVSYMARGETAEDAVWYAANDASHRQLTADSEDTGDNFYVPGFDSEADSSLPRGAVAVDGEETTSGSGRQATVTGKPEGVSEARQQPDETGGSREDGSLGLEAEQGQIEGLTNEVRESGPGTAAGAAGDSGKASITPALEGDAGPEINLFLLDKESNNGVVARTLMEDAPETPEIAALRENLTKFLAQVGIADRVVLQMVDRIVNHDGSVAGGSYRNWIITVAHEVANDPNFVMHHETVHALRDMGLFKDVEWKALERAVKSDKALMADIRRRYEKLYADRPFKEADMVEEGVADMFGMWMRGQYDLTRTPNRGLVQRALEAIKRFFGAIDKATQAAGITDAEKVFRAITAGTIGGRQSRSDGMSVVDDEFAKVETRYSIPDTGAPSPLGRDSSVPHDGIVGEIEARARRLVDAMRGTDNRDPRAESAVDRWRTALQDRMLPVLRAQQGIERVLGRRLTERENPYLGEEIMSGRIGARVERLTSDMVEPLFDAMRAEGVSIDEIETYLYARHAIERNARIAAINPAFAEGEGSGMTDAEAKDILAAVDQSDKADAVKALAARVDAILDYALETRIEGGLLSKTDADLWRKQYKHYVPLRGRGELDPETGGADRPMKGGSGVTVKGKESRRAFGRSSRASDILAYSIMQAEEAIMRAETNRVAQEFHALAQAAPDPEFWRVDKITRKAVWNQAKGQVEYRSESRIAAEDAPYTVSLKIDGVEHRVTMNRENPVAVRVAEAMRNLTAQQVQPIVRFIGWFTRLFSKINTTWNPEFLITNAFRDIQTASVNLSQHDIRGMERAIVSNWRKALMAPKDGTGEWGEARREFEMAGGKVYFNDRQDLQSIRERIERAMSKGDKLSLKRGVYAFFEAVDHVNDRVENAVRLAAFKHARDAGRTPTQAASIARNATVNFTRRGQYGPLINSFYAFFNASVQGSATLVSAAHRSGKVRGMLAGLVMLGFALDMLNRWGSDDDDDGESYWSKVPAFDKSRNLILFVPGWKDTSIKVPLGLGLNAFVSLGRNLSEIMHGRNPLDAGSEAVLTTLDAFNPIGSNSLLTTIAPTAVDPWVEIGLNRDFADRPIQPDQKFGPPETPSNNYFPSVSTASREAALALNKATGGDEVLPGVASVSPEVMDYLAGYFTGGAGRFVMSAANLAAAPFDPDRDLSMGDFPFARRVVGSKPKWLDKSLYYDRINQVDQVKDWAKQFQDKGDQDGINRLIDENRNIAEIEPVAKAAKKEMKKIRKARGENEKLLDLGQIDDATYRANRKLIDANEQEVISIFNSRWNQALNAETTDNGM